MKRTNKDGEHLTQDEHDFVEKNRRCPDCETGQFLLGPEGGNSQNVRCDNPECGSEFNFMGVFGIDRISDASPDKPPVPPVPEGPYR
jgi:hypothetical protein